MDTALRCPYVIQEIARWLPTPYHVMQFRLTSRIFRGALEIARIPKMQPRMLLKFAIANGDTELCKIAREAGAGVLAKIASREIDDELRTMWFEPLQKRAIIRAALHGHHEIVRLLLSWIPEGSKGTIDIFKLLIKGAIIGGGANWRRHIPVEFASVSSGISDVIKDANTKGDLSRLVTSFDIGRSADITLIRAFLSRELPDTSRVNIAHGIIRSKNREVFDQMMREFPCNYAAYYVEIILYTLERGWIDVCESLMECPPFDINPKSVFSLRNIWHEIARLGSIEICERFVNQSELSIIDRESMLITAAMFGRNALCSWLAVNTSMCERVFRTAICTAAEQGHLSTCTLLRSYSPHCFRGFSDMWIGHDMYYSGRANPCAAIQYLKWVIEDNGYLGISQGDESWATRQPIVKLMMESKLLPTHECVRL